MSKTIAQQLNVTDFPFEIRDKNGNKIYYELSNNTWWRSEFDSNGNERFFQDSFGYSSKTEWDSDGNAIYFEDSDGRIRGNEIITVNGIKYQRID